MTTRRMMKKEFAFIEVNLTDDLFANITVDDNTLYVMTNAEIKNEDLQNEIDKITNEMFETTNIDIINIIYGENSQVYNVLKGGNEIDMLLEQYYESNPDEDNKIPEDEITIEEIMQ